MRETNDPGIQKTAGFVADRLSVEPTLALVTGSGLSALAEDVQDPVVIPTEEIPGYPRSTVQGHPGKLISGTLGGVNVIVAQGRVHFYEGYPMHEVAVPTRLFAALGVRAMLLTTATGAINEELHPGDLVRISDHINLMGASPLTGQHWGFEQFPDMSKAYHPELGAALHEVAGREKIELKDGVFVGVIGPSYETPAEIRYMRRIGGDIVSMSTVPEIIAASRLKLPAAAVAYVSNYAAGISGHPLSHDEVSEMGRKVGDTYGRLLKAALPELADVAGRLGG